MCSSDLQKHEVNIYIVTADTEGNVRDNIARKEDDSETIYNEMVEFMKDISKDNLGGIQKSTTAYNPQEQIKMPLFA